MKYIGFIKEHNPIEEAIPFHDVLGNHVENDKQVVSRVIEYLNSGILILAWMGYFMDLKNNKPIAPDSYFSDGTWIWPAYFPHYLNEFPNYQIDNEFLNFLYTKNFKIDVMEKALNKRDIEQQLSLKLNQS